MEGYYKEPLTRFNYKQAHFKNVTDPLEMGAILTQKFYSNTLRATATSDD